jgi:maltooligosyltrehalose trehalohydrolase
VPDPQAQQTFARSKLDWSELSKPNHAELLEWYRGLIKLRFEKTAGIGAKAKVKFDAAKRWLRFEHAEVLALFNFAAVAQRVALPAGTWELVQSSEPIAGDLPEHIPAHGTRIYRRRAAANGA